MKKPIITVFAILALTSCAPKPSATHEVEVWDFDRCLEEGGLFVTEPPACLVDGVEYPVEEVPRTYSIPVEQEWNDTAFFDAIQEAGEPLDFIWEVEIPLIGERGKTAVIDGELVFFFEYESEREALLERTSMENEGKKSDESLIQWGENVFYGQKGAVVAVYVGTNEDILTLLRSAQSAR